jgi:hypothetical protein
MHSQAYGVFLFHWRSKPPAAGAGIDAVAIFGDLFARAGAEERKSEVPEPRECRKIGCVARALRQNRTVPCETELLQAAEDAVLRVGLFARRIDIVDTQQPFAAVGAGVALTAERGFL